MSEIIKEIVPKHIGFIMDGNGRWAKLKNKERTFGHRKAIQTIKEVVSHSFKRGVEVVSLYAFSTENWKRPKKEVDTIFDLLRKFFKSNKNRFIREGIRVVVMGDLEMLEADVKTIFLETIEKTSHFDNKTLNIGINYGSRTEIVRAVNLIIQENLKEITETDFSKFLYTSNLPDPDLIIRTSGENRLSNFMMYQCAYSEFIFTPVMWPDFNKNELDKAITEFNRRTRRFGSV